jgi:hypothetical protein
MGKMFLSVILLGYIAAKTGNVLVVIFFFLSLKLLILFAIISWVVKWLVQTVKDEWNR